MRLVATPGGQFRRRNTADSSALRNTLSPLRPDRREAVVEMLIAREDEDEPRRIAHLSCYGEVQT